MIALPDPVAGNVNRVRFGLRRRWGHRRRRGGLRKIGHRITLRLRRLRVGPEARHPLPLLALLAPVPGHPFLAWRFGPPATAHPEVIAAIIIPGPVAADPDNVPFGFVLGWHFLDGGGRFLGNQGRGRWFGSRGGESLVHRATRHDFHALRHRRRSGVPNRHRFLTEGAIIGIQAQASDYRDSRKPGKMHEHGNLPEIGAGCSHPSRMGRPL